MIFGKFFRKNFGNPREMWVFLELIPTENQDLELYRLNGKNEFFYLENRSTGKLYAVNGQATEAFSSINKEATNPLASLEKQSVGSITSLLNASGQVTDSVTVSKPIYIEPFIGMGMGSAGFGIEPIKTSTNMTGLVMTGGVSAETFVNKKRNMSFSLSPQLFGFSDSEFQKLDLQKAQKNCRSC